MRLSRPRLSLRQQIVGLTAAVTAAASLLLAVIGWIVLGRITTRDVGYVLQDRANAVIGSVRTEGSSLAVPGERLDAGVAVYDDQGMLVAGSPPQALEQTYATLSTTTKVVDRELGDEQRIRAQPFTTDQGLKGVVVVIEPLGPYDEAQRLALIVTIAGGLLAVVSAAGFAAWATRRALSPVGEMARTAAEWSEQDLSRRFDLGPPVNELTSLGVTLDRLLERVSSAIRSEQRLTSELAHELRTPLTAVQGSAELMLLRGNLNETDRAEAEAISAAAQRMAGTISTLLDLARNEGKLRDSGTCSLPAAMEEIGASMDRREITLTVDVPDVRLDLPQSLAVRALSPVVENALRFAATTVEVSADVSENGRVSILVDDDGPGLDTTDDDHIFQPGSSSSSSSGLGLAISRRVARSVGGDVTHSVSPHNRTRFVVRLPRA